MIDRITISAFVTLIAFGGAGHALANEAQKEQAKANFVEADADADGALTLSEFTTLIDLNASHGIGRAATVKRFGRYDVAFGRADGNGDGLVTPEEMQALAESANQ